MPRVQLSSLSSGTVIDRTGPTLAGVPVFVYTHGTTTQVPVYAAETGAGLLVQPLTTDANGQVPGWVDSEQTLDFLASGGRNAATAIEADPLRGDSTDSSQHVVVTSLAADRIVTTPQAIPLLTGSFTAEQAQVHFKTQVASTFLENPSGKIVFLLIYAPAGVATPLTPMTQSTGPNIPAGAFSAPLGSFSAYASTTMVETILTGLTPGTVYNWEIDVFITCYAQTVALPATPDTTRSIAAAASKQVGAKLGDTAVVIRANGNLYQARSNHQFDLTDVLVGSPLALVGGTANNGQVDISPDGKYAVVTNGAGGNSASIYTLSSTGPALSQTVSLVASVFTTPYAVKIDPTSTYAWVGDISTDRLVRVTLATGALGTVIRTGITPYGIYDLDITPDGTKVLVSAYQVSSVVVVNAATQAVTSTLTVGNAGVLWCRAQSNTQAFAQGGVTGGSGYALFPLNLSALTVGASHVLERGGVSAQIMPDGNAVMIAATSGANTVMEYSLPGGNAGFSTVQAYQEYVQFGGVAFGLAVTPNGSILYGQANQLAVLFGGGFYCRPATGGLYDDEWAQAIVSPAH